MKIKEMEELKSNNEKGCFLKKIKNKKKGLKPLILLQKSSGLWEKKQKCLRELWMVPSQQKTELPLTNNMGNMQEC